MFVVRVMCNSGVGDTPTVDHLSSLPPPPHPPGKLVRQGAEARIYAVPDGHLSSLPQVSCIVKERFVKTYRHPALDASLSLQRMRAEARQLVKCRQLGLPVPALLLVNMARRQLWLEDVCTPHGMSLGDWLRALLDTTAVDALGKQEHLDRMALKLGQLLAKMHANNVIHGDLTTANILVQMDDPENKFSNYHLYLIDFGLSSINHRTAANFHDEEVAVDLYVLERALISSLATRTDDVSEEPKFSFTPEGFFESLIAAYTEAYPLEVVRRPFDPTRTSEQETGKKKRPRQDPKSRAPTHEDGVMEVKGVLNTLKEVEARGRKRLMIG
uniref:non-specific serine/threonine protein kinase n=1 Tax=Mesocestoides corti TaxID=53468 RepID=A0A5K3ET86_MESCO